MWNYYTTGKPFEDRYSIFVISATKTSFFALKGKKDYTYLKQSSAKLLKDKTFQETFSGDGFTVKLTTSSLNSGGSQVRTGKLEVIKNEKTVIINVTGKVDYKI